MRGLFIAGVVATVSILALVTGCVGQLDQGQEGVKTSMGVVTTNSMSPGPYLALPWQAVYEYDNRVQTVSDKTEVFTKDTQPADVEYTLKFNLQRGHAGQVYQVAKSDWETKLVSDYVNDSLKNATGKFEADELVQNRDKVADLVQQYLQNRIDQSLQTSGVQPGVIRVTAFTLNDIKFKAGYQAAVNAKAEAEQNAQAEHNRTVQVQEKANQTVISAKADAEAMLIKSQALSQNQNLVSYEAVQKWNGVLPVNIYGAAPIPFVNIK